MYTLKEKVTEELSRLVADSPPPSLQQPQVGSYSRGGNYLSSYFSFVVPLASLDGSKTEKQQYDLKSVHEDFVQQNEQLDKYEECITSCLLKQSCPVNENKQGNPVSENKQPGRPNDEYKDCASGSCSGLEGKR